MVKCMKKVFIVAIILLGIIVLIILASIGPYRLQQARKEAERFADESGISLEYPETIHVSSKGELLTTIWNLAIWEKETKETINSVYGYSDEEYKKSLQPVSGYASKKELLANAMEDRWREERKSLTESIQGTIETMYGSRHNLFGLSKSTLLESYRREVFPYIIKTMKAVERGDGTRAYDLNRYSMDEDWCALSMDIAYCLHPDMMTEACETDLAEAIKSNMLTEIKYAVRSAEDFSNRYDVKISSLSRAKSKQSALEYANKPDVPRKGMSTSSARSTKLGAPTRTTSQSQSWAGKKHTYGDMYWDKGGRQVFKAHYLDGSITDVWDTRSVARSHSSYHASSGTGSSGKTLFDPDDHDIEAYYDDNRDIYDDYDDAYDGFLDDDDAWDDY